MIAEVKELWLIVECPNCKRPQSINKYVANNKVHNLIGVRPYYCDMCANPFRIEIQFTQTMEKGVPDV